LTAAISGFGNWSSLRTTNERHFGSSAKKSAIVSEVARLKKAAGVERRLAELGVHRTDVPILTGKAIKDPCMVTNPRSATPRDIEVVYEEAL
jgi:alcohol dehydrogenase class IV